MIMMYPAIDIVEEALFYQSRASNGQKKYSAKIIKKGKIGIYCQSVKSKTKFLVATVERWVTSSFEFKMANWKVNMNDTEVVEKNFSKAELKQLNFDFSSEIAQKLSNLDFEGYLNY